jgi:hypothetical protein
LAEPENQAASAEQVIVQGLAIVQALVGLAVLAARALRIARPALTGQADGRAAAMAVDREADMVVEREADMVVERAVSRAVATPASTAAGAPAVLGALGREATAAASEAEGCAVADSTAADAVDSAAGIEAAAIAEVVVAGGAPTSGLSTILFCSDGSATASATIASSTTAAIRHMSGSLRRKCRRSFQKR